MLLILLRQIRVVYYPINSNPTPLARVRDKGWTYFDQSPLALSRWKHRKLLNQLPVEQRRIEMFGVGKTFCLFSVQFHVSPLLTLKSSRFWITYYQRQWRIGYIQRNMEKRPINRNWWSLCQQKTYYFSSLLCPDSPGTWYLPSVSLKYLATSPSLGFPIPPPYHPHSDD